jgi:hypothetical protein
MSADIAFDGLPPEKFLHARIVHTFHDRQAAYPWNRLLSLLHSRDSQLRMLTLDVLAWITKNESRGAAVVAKNAGRDLPKILNAFPPCVAEHAQVHR